MSKNKNTYSQAMDITPEKIIADIKKPRQRLSVTPLFVLRSE